MMSTVGQREPTMFQDTWQTWLILRHFLPARLQRRLVHEIVSIASGATLKFEELFEELVVEQPIWNESWMIRPRSGQKEYAAALQLWAQSIVWQNDDNSIGSMDDEQGSSRISLSFLNMVTDFSAVDFGWSGADFEAYLERYSAQIQPTFRSFLDTFKAAQKAHKTKTPIECWDKVEAMVAAMEMPLRAITVKHFADLCADYDSWKHALEGYRKVESLLEGWNAPGEWSDIAMTWKTITMQSCATALHTLNGPASEVTMLEAAIDSTALDADPVLAANAGLDRLANHSKERKHKDTQVAWQRSPLLHLSHHAHRAVAYWMVAKHQDATRRFWSLLRRQIAFGAATSTRETKGLYARCLLDQIATNLASQDEPDMFVTAMRLLLESQNPKHIAQIDWTAALVNAYVTSDNVLQTLLDHAHAHEGTKIPRTRVLVELFKTWALLITPSRKTLIAAIWKHLAHIAHDFAAEFHHNNDIGRPALKALLELGEARPELIPDVGPDVAKAICKQLREKFHWGQVEAIKAAGPYAEVWDDESFGAVTTGILDLLEAEDPIKHSGHFTGPPFLFLVDQHVCKRLQNDDELSRRALRQIFRYGLANEDQPMMIFFHLADFKESLLEEEATRQKLAESLQRVRNGALQSNSSNVIDNIRALLVAPRIAGYDGIRDALDGLLKIIESAQGGLRDSIGFPFIDGPLLLLVEYQKRIRTALSDHQEWFDEKLVDLADRLADKWEFSPAKQLVFAPFAIPAPTKPDPVIIHNCAFASIRFAYSVGREERMHQALDKACENEVLRSAIIIARATHLSGTKYGLNRQQEIASDEDRDTFYAAIGRRLIYLQRLPPEAARPFATKLIEKCMQLGPHSGDAAILLAAANLGLHEQVRANGLRAYDKRVRRDSETRPVILPILSLFWPSEAIEEDEP